MKKQLSIYSITKDKRMQDLDSFMWFMELELIEDEKHRGKYTIWDNQNKCIYDDENEDAEEKKYTITEVIRKIVCYALDYELDKFFEDCDIYNNKAFIDYINNLYKIAEEYITDKNSIDWLIDKKIDIIEMTRLFEEINR